jgi:hypothetical protein
MARSCGDRVVVAAGFAQLHAFEQGDLIRADDQGVGKALRDGAGLQYGQALGGVVGGFAGQRRLVHVRRGDLEGHAQAGEQFAAVGGGGGQHEAHGVKGEG